MGLHIPQNQFDQIQQNQLAALEQTVLKQEQQVKTKHCNCRKSFCQNMYCDCLAVNEKCDDLCNCLNCCNLDSNIDNHIKDKNQKKGCNCRKSNCLKKYCQCYLEGLQCTKYCKCFDCKNTSNIQLFKNTNHISILN